MGIKQQCELSGIANRRVVDGSAGNRCRELEKKRGEHLNTFRSLCKLSRPNEPTICFVLDVAGASEIFHKMLTKLQVPEETPGFMTSRCDNFESQNVGQFSQRVDEIHGMNFTSPQRYHFMQIGYQFLNTFAIPGFRERDREPEIMSLR
jgi:hypothetical protein